MKDAFENTMATTIAERIAGEDINRGEYITTFNAVIELPSYLWCCSSFSLTPEEPIRFRYVPNDAGTPLKVLSVCLPFVYAQDVQGVIVTIDTRHRQVVRLDRKCARRVWRKLKATSNKKKRGNS